jgi:hypothetical protein
MSHLSQRVQAMSHRRGADASPSIPAGNSVAKKRMTLEEQHLRLFLNTCSWPPYCVLQAGHGSIHAVDTKHGRPADAFLSFCFIKKFLARTRGTTVPRLLPSVGLWDYRGSQSRVKDTICKSYVEQLCHGVTKGYFRGSIYQRDYNTCDVYSVGDLQFTFRGITKTPYVRDFPDSDWTRMEWMISDKETSHLGRFHMKLKRRRWSERCEAAIFKIHDTRIVSLLRSKYRVPRLLRNKLFIRGIERWRQSLWLPWGPMALQAMDEGQKRSKAAPENGHG